MSDNADGTPPPPPPYGNDPQGGQPYGAPPPVPQYGAPPPEASPYGTPPPGASPYGTPPPAAPPYGAPPSGPQYAAPPAGQPYGAPTSDPQFGYPPPGQPYGYPPAAATPYGQPGYGAPVYAGTAGLATMGKRFAARLIDMVIAGVVVGLLALLLIGTAATQVQTDPVTGQVTSGGAGLAGAIFGLIAIATAFGLFYEVGLIALRGATPGKQIMKIKVVREADGQVPGWGPAVLRWLIPQVGGLVCGIGQYVVYLSPFWDNTQRLQGWHDKVAKTLVINT
jgi:uncharacterized RDD family membrane protein YckC